MTTKKQSAAGFVAALLILVGILVWIYRAEPAFKTPVSTATVTACRQDLQCWADKSQAWAETYCEAPIEHLSPYHSHWTDGFGKPRFTRRAWADKAIGTITYAGDRIEVENQSGAFEQHAYKCTFDPVGNKVLGVATTPGRLP